LAQEWAFPSSTLIIAMLIQVFAETMQESEYSHPKSIGHQKMLLRFSLTCIYN
jgi:hypothetical protein